MYEVYEHAAFYEEHYSDWTVHELPLMVYVPTTKGVSHEEALVLVREILDEAAFDIRVTDARLDVVCRDAEVRALTKAADEWTNRVGSVPDVPHWLRERAARTE